MGKDLKASQAGHGSDAVERALESGRAAVRESGRAAVRQSGRPRTYSSASSADAGAFAIAVLSAVRMVTADGHERSPLRVIVITAVLPSE